MRLIGWLITFSFHVIGSLIVMTGLFDIARTPGYPLPASLYFFVIGIMPVTAAYQASYGHAPFAFPSKKKEYHGHFQQNLPQD